MEISEIMRLNSIRERLENIAASPRRLWGELLEVADEAKALYRDCKQRISQYRQTEEEPEPECEEEEGNGSLLKI